MINQTTNLIDVDIALPKSEDYNKLKSLGIEYIQELSKNIWTDFNAHDPGVTSLELLCYALTDLAYRTNLPIADILTSSDQTAPLFEDAFFSAKQILTHHPVTIQDYRKLVLTQFSKIVRNVWFETNPTEIEPKIFVDEKLSELTLVAGTLKKNINIKGFYNVKIEFTESLDPAITKEEYLQIIHGFLMNHRNLCEDFLCVSEMEHELVGVCMELDFDGTVKPLLVKNEIYKRLYEYCSPVINRYSIKQLYEKGKTTEQIFTGYNTEFSNSTIDYEIYKEAKGFMDDNELVHFEKRSVLHTSDIINFLMDIKGIKNIRKFHFSRIGNSSTDVVGLEENISYNLSLLDNSKAFQFFIDTAVTKANKIKFFFDDLPINVNQIIEKAEIINNSNSIVNFEDDLIMPVGANRNLEKFYSIQNEFPNAYFIGQQGISDSATELRKAQRLQFKAYLLFFDQIMADYLSQLNNVKNLLSWNSEADYRSYFYQKLSEEEISDLEKLKTVKSYDELFDTDSIHANYYQDVLKIDNQKNFDRRNKFMNHLLGRFNETFVEFSIVQFFNANEVKYGKSSIIADKKSFLRTFAQSSSNRLKATNYKTDIWNNPNLSGYEMRVSKKIGLSNTITWNPDILMCHSLAHPVFPYTEEKEIVSLYDYSSLSFDRQFGFHIIEHILLKPISLYDPEKPNEPLLSICTDATDKDCSCQDPYSFKISVVLPGWLPISLDPGFRKYIERVFREELPAHIAAKICWISPQQMLEFEQNYFCFFKELKTNRTNCKKSNLASSDALKNMVETVNNLKNIYPPSHLVECDDIEFDLNQSKIKRRPMRLGQAVLSKDLIFGVNWFPYPAQVWDGLDLLESVIASAHLNENGQGITFKMNNPLHIGKNQSFLIDITDSQFLKLQNDEKIPLDFERKEKKDFQFKLKVSINQINVYFQWNYTKNKHQLYMIWGKYWEYNVEFETLSKPVESGNTTFFIELKVSDNNEYILKPKLITKKRICCQEENEKLWLTQLCNIDDKVAADFPDKPKPLEAWILDFFNITQDLKNTPSNK